MAVLLAAELFVVGAIIWSLGARSFSVNAAGMHHVHGEAKDFAPIDAGTFPHVVVDDPGSGVTVSASTDGRVHVTDDSWVHGWIFGNVTRPALRVNQTADGVSVQRPGDNGTHVAVFGIAHNHIVLGIPEQSRLDIRQCSGADIRDLRASVNVHSVDGHIELDNVHATSLAISSDDGRLRMNDVSAPSIDASTQDGSIKAQALDVRGGRIATQDGSITLDLRSPALTIHARTQDGSVHYNGRRIASDNDVTSSDFTVGMGGSPLAVSTQDGRITITTNGAQ